MTAPIRRPRAAPGGADARAGGPRGGTPGGQSPRGGRPPRWRPGGGRGRRADPVRRLAYDVLIAVEQRDAYANLLLPSMLAERGLAGRDAALATELTYGTLRGRGSYDAILGLCSDRSLDRVDPPLREVLRLGTHQLLATRVRPARGRRDLRGPRPGPGRPALGRLRQRGAAPGVHPRPGSLDRGCGAGPRHRSARSPGRPVQPSPVDGEGGGRRAGGGRRRGPWPGPRPPWRRTGPGPGSPCAPCPAWLIKGSWWPPAPSPPPGRPMGRTWRAGTRPRSRRSAPGARPSRTRRASWPRIAVARAELTGPDSPLAGPVRRPGRQGPAAGRPGSAAGSAPAGHGRPPAPGPAGPRRRGGHRRGGCGSRRRDRTRLARGGLRPGAGRRPVLRHRRPAPPPGGPLAPVGRGRPGPGRAAAQPAPQRAGRGPAGRCGRLRHLLAAPRPRPGTCWPTCSAAATTSRCSTRPPSWPRCPACAARSLMAGTPSSGRTGTVPTRSSWPCCAAVRTPGPASIVTAPRLRVSRRRCWPRGCCRKLSWGELTGAGGASRRW